MRLIDADALNSIKFHPLPYTHITPSDADAESYKRGWNDAIDSIIENEPTIELETIRCKDCKYSDTDNTLGVMFCWRISYHEANEDGFCSWAERKDGSCHEPST